MTDIIEKLNELYDCEQGDPDFAFAKEAADEIERLRKDLSIAVFTDSEYCKVLEAEVERLRRALRLIANDYVELSQEKAYWQRDEHVMIARKALEK